MTAVTPIFLFSLPRSGSTLAQRVLATHPKIATESEPWFLLPVYAGLERGLCKEARYSQASLEEAIHDLCAVLPGGISGYHAAVRAFANAIYTPIAEAQSARFFLDKTPRYHLIAHHLAEAFPDAKFIFLWRNPLATLGSRIHSFGGVWRLPNYHVDLFDGLANLVDVYRRHQDRVHAVRFEDLVLDPEPTFRRLFEYIGVSFDPDSLKNFSAVTLKGKMGDKTGLRQYQTLDRGPLEKWAVTLSSPVRREWCRRYLNWIGQDRLSVMGYDKMELLEQLKRPQLSWKSVPSDLVRLAYFRLTRSMEREGASIPHKSV